MGRRMMLTDWSDTGAELEQKTVFAPLPLKREPLEQRIWSVATDCSATVATAAATVWAATLALRTQPSLGCSRIVVSCKALSAAVGAGCRRVLVILAKLEGYQVVFTAGAIVGMVVEAGMMVAVMTGHSLWIGAVHAH